MNKFDVAVIGGGPGGYVAAIRAGQLGKKVVLFENQHLGGICLNWGCIPTKTLLKSAELVDSIKHASDHGLDVSELKIDMKKMVARSRQVANSLQNGVKMLLKKNKITVIEGFAKLVDSSQISCNKLIYQADNIIIATGAKPRILKGLEPDYQKILTYKEAMILDHIPKNLAIIGAGAIGVEFASFFNSLGSNVTLIEMQKTILSTEDIEISNLAAKAFEKNGIKILTNTTVEKVTNSNQNDDKIELKINNNCVISSTSFDKLIVAVGVVGNVDDLGLENTQVKVANSQILVDNHYMTDDKKIYAIGDVIAPPWLAHKASHEGILCAEHISGLSISPIKRENIPGCVYSNPQIASIGLTEEKALQLGHKIKVGRFPFSANGKALAIGENMGLVKTIFEQDTGELLGAHMIGHEVTELIHSFVLAKSAELTEHEIMHTIFAHPTLSEMVHESVLNAFGRSIHV